ncbi:MAG: VTT domain-containing protein [Patescibacteria group bacterium]
MFDIPHIIQAGGLVLIAAIIFAESGMFVGFFFPGDTLLLTAGVFAAQDKLPLLTTIIVISVAAIVGDNLGYHIGKRWGRGLFSKPDGIVFRQEYVGRAESFYERFGSKTMLLAHFVPVVRTFAPAVAGVAKMNYKQFFVYDAIGDIAWAVSITMVGYWFGTKIPNIDHYILLAVGCVMLITLGPTVYHLVKAILETRRKKKG